MWIIFLPGSSSRITLNLALTIYNDWRFLLITNDRWHLTFFDIKTHNSCISKRCDLMPGCQKFSQNFHSKVLPKFLENIRCWFRNVKRFQILIWLFGGQILRAWAYFNIARLSTLKGSFKLPTNIRCLFRNVKQFQKLCFFSSQTLRAWHTKISLVCRHLEIAPQVDHTTCVRG